jgi:aminoglycoside phosphotransferase (APT) family kinase protein
MNTMPPEEIIYVREGHRLSTPALADYLYRTPSCFSGNPEVRQFGCGQSNPTYLPAAGGKEHVLRKKPSGKLLPSAHAVDREYRILGALKAAGVPVPEPYLLCPDDSIIGTAFCVMERVSGRIFQDPTASQARDARERS